MKSARILIPMLVLVLLSMTVSMLSCGGGGSPIYLDGNWTLTTTPDGGNQDFGNGTYTLTLLLSSEELKLDAYSGEGLIEDEPYEFSVWVRHEPDEDGNDYFLFIYKEGESLYNDSIECVGVHDFATSASGTYSGQGDYTSYGTGLFNTTKL